MIMLSALRRFHLVDGQQRVRLPDFAVALLEGDYPPITHIYYRQRNQYRVLEWDEVQAIDWRGRQIRVANLGDAPEAPADALVKVVLLVRDVLDSLVLDLQTRGATRANDLWLEEERGHLFLKAADTSATAALRRITAGLYGRAINKKSLQDWRYVEFLRGNPQAVANGAGYHLRINRLPPGEIARLTELIPYLHAAELITLLPDPLAAATLDYMQPERQLQVFEELDEAQGLRLLNYMTPNGAADLVGRLETIVARRYLNQLPQRQSERIIDLLRYPEDTVGGIMTNDVVTAPAVLTVAQARETLRRELAEPAFVHFVYVVGDGETNQLRGVVSLRDLLVADEEMTLEQVMKPYLVTLRPLEPARAAAYRVINSNLAALPVVGDVGQLLGAVTVDMAVGLVAPASWGAQAPKVFS